MMRVVFFLLLFAAAAVAQTRPATSELDNVVEIRHGRPYRSGERGMPAHAFDNLLRSLQPAPDDPADAVTRAIEVFSSHVVKDPRIFPFDVAVDYRDGALRLSGYIANPPQRVALLYFLKLAKLDVDASSVATTGIGYGRVLKRSMIVSQVAEPRENLDEVAVDDAVFLLEERDTFFRVLCPDGYSGFIPSSSVQKIDESQFDALLDRRVTPSPIVEKVLATARTRLGVPYVWGGTSENGIDCSGLTQFAYRVAGVQLPRDADQQVCVGRLVGTSWHRSAIRAGDLLFFMGRRGGISHVAIAIDQTTFIEASDGGVKISSFDPGKSNYSERRVESLCYVKRLIEEMR